MGAAIVGEAAALEVAAMALEAMAQGAMALEATAWVGAMGEVVGVAVMAAAMVAPTTTWVAMGVAAASGAPCVGASGVVPEGTSEGVQEGTSGGVQVETSEGHWEASEGLEGSHEVEVLVGVGVILDKEEVGAISHKHIETLADACYRVFWGVIATPPISPLSPGFPGSVLVVAAKPSI